MTRAVIPVFAKQGIRAVSGGVNGFAAPPGVPKNTPIIWRDEESGHQIIAMWHPGGGNSACAYAYAKGMCHMY